MNRDIEEIRRYITDACVQIARMRGYSDALGVLRGILMLSETPLSLDDLVELTGYSKSTVSTNMSILEGLGVAKRVITPGEKRYRYIPVTDTDMLRNAMMNHVRREISTLMSALDRAEKALSCADSPEAGQIRERINGIRNFYSKTDRLLNLIQKYDVDRLIEILERSG
ncbi:MAG: ArsR family transcriptional regulator [Methanothrix sp.]|uniref:GbsR/MarR family transcriptional regulator n=1 Tax=Methanothrix sp. TaxID=90426 RepID=UPI00247D8A47|nr:ArsR family transcriptional regulator [Methanothrix sp.]